MTMSKYKFTTLTTWVEWGLTLIMIIHILLELFHLSTLNCIKDTINNA